MSVSDLIILPPALPTESPSAANTEITMPTATRSLATDKSGVRPAFTLIELLIVVAIIAVLIAASMAVGQKVLGAGKVRVTEDTIRVLDGSVLAYEQETGSMPPAMFTLQSPRQGNFEYAIFDGRPDVAGNYEAAPVASVARFAAMCKLVPSASSVLNGLNAKFMRNVTIVAAGANLGVVPDQPATGIEVIDAWNRPIRMVHPAYDGGYGAYMGATTMQSSRGVLTISEMRGASSVGNTFRRSYRPFDPASASNPPSPVGDADEGICPNRRPYFYSAGADGDPGKREDNVYTTRPSFPQETSRYK